MISAATPAGMRAEILTAPRGPAAPAGRQAGLLRPNRFSKHVDTHDESTAFHRSDRRRQSLRQARLHPRRPQRAAGRRRATSPKTRASAPRCRASSTALDAGAAVMVTSHLGRPTEGAVQARGLARAGREAPGASCSGRDVPLVRELGRRRRRAAGPGRAARELPRQQGREEERRGARAEDGRALRHLRQRRVRHRAPRRGLDLRHRASTRRSPAPARCSPPRSTRITQGAGQPEAAAGGDRRRLARSRPSSPSCKSLAEKVDQLIVGGGIANTFMLAAGLKIGKSLAEADLRRRSQGGDRGDARARRRGADPDRRRDGEGVRGRRAGDREGRRPTWPTTT